MEVRAYQLYDRKSKLYSFVGLFCHPAEVKRYLLSRMLADDNLLNFAEDFSCCCLGVYDRAIGIIKCIDNGADEIYLSDLKKELDSVYKQLQYKDLKDASSKDI